MKKLIVIASLMLAAKLTAQVRIGEKDALSTAERFLKKNAKEQVSVLNLNEVVNSRISGQPNLYMFSIEPRGFIIVSAQDEVLAYSFTSDLPEKGMTSFEYWLYTYNNRTDYLFDHPDCATKKAGYQQKVEPMLTSCWGQGCFHNEACPVDSNGPCDHVSAGCVAIAMAQIMYYHKFPAEGNNMTTYYSPLYGSLSANFGNTVYHWELMTDTLHESNLAVATLIFHCGLSVAMKYGAQLSLASSADAAYAFCQYFHYNEARLIRRKKLNDEEWTALIKENLDMHLPLYYAGGSSLGQHAFVCDGYDSNGLFHFNLGWDGVADGYYTIDDPSGFSNSQLIIHVSPFMPVINLEKEICEGETYYFFGECLSEAGHYSTIHNQKIYELDLATKPLPTIHCSKDTIIKYGTSAQLTASGADSYLWSTGDTTATITVAPESDQTFIVIGFVKNGCSADANIKVRVDNNNDLMVYPNPAHDIVTINMFEMDEVNLFDQFGVQVAHIKANRHAVELDLSQFQNGLYIIQAKHLKNAYYDKLIVLN